MTQIKNSRVFGRGIFTDVNLYVPANTTYKEGTVLGRNADGNITAYTSEVADSTPLYILATTVTNDTETAETYYTVRALESGEAVKSELTFIKDADATDNKVLDAMKINNFRLLNVQELTEENSLSK